MAIWSQFRSILFGGAIGAAARTAIEPQIEPARQRAWSNNRNRILELGPLANLVAEGVLAEGDVADSVARQGYELDALRALVELELVAPGIGQVMTSRRRGELSDAQWSDALGKLKIKPEFRPKLELLLAERLTPADLANAVQQGFIPPAGLLAGDTGGTHDITPPVEELPIPTLREFRDAGLDRDRAAVLAQLVGLPPGVMELLDLWNRGVITETAVEHGIREGHTKTKWTSALKQLRHYLLSPADIAGLRLRGWIDRATANELGALRGASPEVMDYLFLNRGRPATTHQVHLGYARGGRLAEAGADEQAAFRRAIEESDIRPEWFDVLWSQRYTMPSAFVLRALTQDGTFTRAQAEQVLLESGWRPDLAAQAARVWSAGGAAGGKAETQAQLGAEYEGLFITAPEYRAALAELGYLPAVIDHLVHLGDARRVAKWRDAVVTRAHKLYTSHAIGDAAARTALGELGISAEAIDHLMVLWTLERDITALQLTPAQIRRGYVNGALSLEQATARLVELGYSPTDAGVYLSQPPA